MQDGTQEIYLNVEEDHKKTDGTDGWVDDGPRKKICGDREQRK